MNCGKVHRYGSDLVLLWQRLACAAPIPSLAWELAYATGVALKSKKRKEREEGKKEGKGRKQRQMIM